MKANFFSKTTIIFLLSPIFLYAQQIKYNRAKISLDAQHSIKQLAQLGVEVDHGYYAKNAYVINDFSEKEIQLISNQGFKVEILIDDVSKYYELGADENAERVDWACNAIFTYRHQKPKNFKLGSMAGFYTYKEMLAIFADMKAKFPKLITSAAPIDTFKTYEKRPIHWLKISDNPDKNEPNESKTFYNALHHAREPAGLSQLIYYMWYLLENYDKSLEVKYLMDNSELYFVPCVNPDGYVFNETNKPNGGGLWRKNRRMLGDTAFGVDLNRNYGFKWAFDDNGSSPFAQSETYRGDKAFSEPETQAIKFLCEKNQFGTILNYHSYGNLLIYPWAFSDTLADASFLEMGKALTRYNQYQYGTTTETVGYFVNGDSDDWMYGETKAYSFTPEVSESGFWINASNILPVCADNLHQNLVAAQLNLQTATLLNTSPHFSDSSGKITYDIQRIGSKDGIFKVNLLPISNNVIANNPPVDYNLKRFEKKSGTFNYQVKAGTAPNSEIRFLLGLYNGTFFKYDTIKIYYQNDAPLLSDNANTTSGWISSGKTWATTNSTFISAPNSITDSPSGNYEDNSTTVLASKNYITLPNKDKIILRFWVKWDIERDRDYAMVSIATSANPNAFTALCGKYSKTGSFLQAYNAPIYDEKSDWVLEEIDLSTYAGKSVLLHYELVSDDANNYDGIYIDDISISAINPLTTAEENIEIGTFEHSVYPNPSIDFFKIDLKNDFFEKNFIFILNDASGKNILQKNIQNADNELLIDVKNIPSGIYFYTIRSEKSISTPKKIIILK